MLILAVAFFLGMGCDSPTSSKNGTGTLKVLLTDAPASYEAVNVTISQVAVHYAGKETTDESSGWEIIAAAGQTFNLLNLTQGITALLGNASLPVGHYTQVRLIVSDASVVNEGTHTLDIPSDTVKLVCGFDIKEGEVTTLIIDFDADRSVIITGEGQYKLQPVIRIVDEEEAGSISGTVSPYEVGLKAYAKIGTEIITSCDVISITEGDIEKGQFTLFALAAYPNYTVTVENGSTIKYETTGISVSSGEDTNMSELSLITVTP